MTKADKLEEAIEYRDRLKELLIFKKGYEGWKGPVTICFGSYKAELSYASSDGLRQTLDTEEKMLRNTLDILGVDLE